ncbi:hypothetical protein C4K39_5447 [Pseudomonas sessilinigenes]|nr:hypothetical protein C4K39_5447 [Pseudomonas sessilinigenes]
MALAHLAEEDLPPANPDVAGCKTWNGCDVVHVLSRKA